MRFVLLISWFLLSWTVYGQAPAGYVVVDSIRISGNRQTQESVVRRELPLRSGDTLFLALLPGKQEEAEQLLMNTGLFNQVNVSLEQWVGETNHIQLLVELKEAWYLYPIPFFELADRNFNVWWVEQKRSLQRVNFGMDFKHRNMSGRADPIEFTAKFGYTRLYRLGYRLPYLNRAKTIGFSSRAYLSQNREVNYLTENNKQLFFRQEEGRFTYQQFHLDGGLTFRPRLRATHSLTLSYDQNRIASVIGTELNPDFFLQGRTTQRFFSLRYRYLYDGRDNRFYAWKGHLVEVALEKNGLGIFPHRNAFVLWTQYDRYIPFSERFSLTLSGKSKLSLVRGPQPYNDNRAIGFGNYDLHGYEYYIIDGQDMAMVNSSLHFRLLSGRINFGKLVPVESFRILPFKLYLAWNNDVGYVNNPYSGANNPFTNTLLWGGGLGLNILLYYDMVFRIEYSFNRRGESGIFFNFNSPL